MDLLCCLDPHRPSDASAWARRTAESRPCGALGPRRGLESADALPPNPAWQKMINNLVAKRITKLADLLCYIYILLYHHFFQLA